VQTPPGDDPDRAHRPVGGTHWGADTGGRARAGGGRRRHGAQRLAHNMDEIERKDVRIGDTVLLERAGDVIPYVVKVITAKRTGNEKKFRMPRKCPVGGAEVARAEDEVAYRCIGLSCPAQLKQAVRFFGARGALDIEGLGEKLVDQLVERGLVRDLADLYRLDEDALAA